MSSAYKVIVLNKDPSDLQLNRLNFLLFSLKNVIGKVLRTNNHRGLLKGLIIDDECAELQERLQQKYKWRFHHRHLFLSSSDSML